MTIAIAHRGEPADNRENTLPSFLAAVSLGADMVELDCRVTRDKRVVVLHDPTLERLWHLNTAVSELTFEDVRGLDVEGYHVPGLGEVLNAVSVPVMVDMDDPASVLYVLGEVVSAGALERCLFAGNLRGLEVLRKKNADSADRINLDGKKVAQRRVIGGTAPRVLQPPLGPLDARCNDQNACGRYRSVDLDCR